MNLTHTGRNALITGASRLIGIGAATARVLAASGANIVFTHWSQYDREQYGTASGEPELLLAELRELGVEAAAIEVDLSAPDCATTVFDAAESTVGKIDILINNAAHSTRENVNTLTVESLDRHYFVNARASAMLTVEFARRFRGTHGRVVSFSSGQHLGPMPGELGYIMSKGAIIAFAQSISQDLIKQGITINIMNPGGTDTGWMTPDFLEAARLEHPAKHVGTPEDAARSIAWLTSEEAFWINGQILNSEGFFRG
ncbi:MAG: SDR family oxidoreductase [Thermomicrobiales bacterium]